MVDGDEVAEAHGEAPGLDRDLAVVLRIARRDLDGLIGVAALAGQQGDESRLERGRPGLGEQLRRTARGQHATGIHGDQPVEGRGFLHV